MKILGGVLAPDSGKVLINGRSVTINSVAEADRQGIRIIHQELSLAPNLSVAENIHLGREPTRFGFLLRRRMQSSAERLLADLGLTDYLQVNARVGSLSPAQRQLVEIARSLAASPRILILDEPTSSLSHAEAELLFSRLRHLRDRDVGIVLITHRLDEVAAIADCVTVLRDGCTVESRDAVGELSGLVRSMVGREVREFYPAPTSKPGKVVLKVEELRAPGVNNVSFELRSGEILGFAGLVGAGRTELARTLFGLTPATRGCIEIDGRTCSIRNPRDARRNGIVLVPEDRKQSALVLNRSVDFNASLPWTRIWSRGFWPDSGGRQAISWRVVREFEVRTRDLETRVATLSGGNQQKIVVGRWIEQPPKVLILDEPTRGVDIGARVELFGIIHRLAERGLAVILISSDLPEVLNISHRVAVYKDGRIDTILPASEATPEGVMTRLTRGAIT